LMTDAIPSTQAATFPSDAFFDSLASSIQPVGEANMLPPLCYTDAAFYEFEKAALFDREWLCVGRESWVSQPGDYFTTSIVGEPLLIARNAEGLIRAMSAVCQHRAMLVAEGHGQRSSFVCPYHHWAYSLDGALLGAPAMDRSIGFDKKDFCLPRFAVEIWQGFIFVNFDLTAPPLGPRLRAVDEVLANYHVAQADGPRPGEPMSLAWNWKVMFENNNDGYHANKLHRGPLHDFVPSRLATFPELPADTAGYFRHNGTTHPDAAFNATQKAVFKRFPDLTDEQRSRMSFVNVPPTLSLVVTCEMVIYMILRPDSAQTHQMDQGLLFAPGAMDDPLFQGKLDLSMSSVSHIVAQDLHVDEMVQIGLRSRYAKRGRYSWQEEAQRQLNSWLVPRYLDARDALHAGSARAVIPMAAVRCT